MSALRLAPAIAALMLAGACDPSDPYDDPPEPRSRSELIGQGQAMAETLCSGCHAVGTSGESPHREAIPFRQLSWNYPVEALAEPLAEGIMVGHPDMPEWQFDPQDIDALLAYIETIQEPRGT